jgi:hypothetical protein
METTIPSARKKCTALSVFNVSADGFSWCVRNGMTTMAVKASAKAMETNPRLRSRLSRLLTAVLVAAARADGVRPGSPDDPRPAILLLEIPDLKRSAEKLRLTQLFQPLVPKERPLLVFGSTSE